MARITVEDCLSHVPNRFFLVLLAAERTKQLLKGEQALIDDYRDNKEVVTALREIAAGRILPDLAAYDENAEEAWRPEPAHVPLASEDELPPEAGL
ncbi:MAG: DNA-directed RNA polymerase subunit omega [Deltaproteobacteria bacterium]|nr:DNA-directed RNA polymerase subunit omega [Deltaproteobacteria bacterium]